MSAYWPYNVTPPAVEDTIKMLHFNEPHLEIMKGGDLDPRNPRALADFLQKVRGRNTWTYCVNNLLQIAEAIRRGYTFRVIELFNSPGVKQSPQSVKVAGMFQVDPIQGLHRIWLNQDFVRDRADIPKLDQVQMIA